MSFCGLMKGISLKIYILCVKINKHSFESFCVWIWLRKTKLVKWRQFSCSGCHNNLDIHSSNGRKFTVWSWVDVNIKNSFKYNAWGTMGIESSSSELQVEGLLFRQTPVILKVKVPKTSIILNYTKINNRYQQISLTSNTYMYINIKRDNESELTKGK